ncbi:hypothetical protein [uncultured Roseibium sp.]|uniref:hypothetical protein n=1 Tax=uncultured Roseibium sp. TaxID=1936171 RepID=UPI003217EA62
MSAKTCLFVASAQSALANIEPGRHAAVFISHPHRLQATSQDPLEKFVSPGKLYPDAIMPEEGLANLKTCLSEQVE